MLQRKVGYPCMLFKLLGMIHEYLMLPLSRCCLQEASGSLL